MVSTRSLTGRQKMQLKIQNESSSLRQPCRFGLDSSGHLRVATVSSSFECFFRVAISPFFIVKLLVPLEISSPFDLGGGVTLCSDIVSLDQGTVDQLMLSLILKL